MAPGSRGAPDHGPAAPAPATPPAAAPAEVPVRTCLVLGGARSGKSRHALALAEGSGLDLVYCATAMVSDDSEMADRVARHRAERDGRWCTIEVPLDLAAALAAESRPGRLVLIDCLTLWLTNAMLAGRDLEAETAGLAACVAGLPGPMIAVSNEVGGGIVPENAMARAFRDHQGRLNQAMAAACEAAVLVVAGQVVVLKPRADPVLRLDGAPLGKR